MGNCNCYYDGPAIDFLDTKTVKARKPHKCCECLTVIQPGEKYQRDTGSWEGGFATFATCELCADLRNRCDFACDPYGMMIESAGCSKDHDDDMEVQAFLKRREQGRLSP